MTELLCHTDSYVQEFDAMVVAADAAKSTVVLDRTAFYPGGGGQPHDLGWLQTSVESLAVTFINPAFKDAIAFVVLILVLMFRPGGILGEALPDWKRV